MTLVRMKDGSTRDVPSYVAEYIESTRRGERVENSMERPQTEQAVEPAQNSEPRRPRRKQ